MGPRELPADFADLRRGLALREHDLGKADPALAVEIERVVGAAHREAFYGHLASGA